MKKRIIMTGIMLVFLMSGCSSKNDDAENKALREQISRLEAKLDSLEQQGTTAPVGDTADTKKPQESMTPDNSMQPDTKDTAKPQESTPNNGTAASTTYTMEELTAKVAAYVKKAEAASPGGTAAENMEMFFSLKQEEKQIDDALDRHEDELEYLYRAGSLTRDEYKSLERELERLEDRLDDAEDRLEYIFGTDD